MPPMREHLDQLQTKAQSRLKISGQAALIQKQCKWVATKLRKRRVDTAPNTPGIQKGQWALAITEETYYHNVISFCPTIATRYASSKALKVLLKAFAHILSSWMKLATNRYFLLHWSALFVWLLALWESHGHLLFPHDTSFSILFYVGDRVHSNSILIFGYNPSLSRAWVCCQNPNFSHETNLFWVSLTQFHRSGSRLSSM